MPQSIQNYPSQPDWTITFAQDSLKAPPLSETFLNVLHGFKPFNLSLGVPFRISAACLHKGNNDKNIVYVEVLSDLQKNFSDVAAMPKIEVIGNSYKLTGFLVSFKEYLGLMSKQKSELEHMSPGLNAAKRALIGRIDNDHYIFYSHTLPQDERDELKPFFQECGLSLDSYNIDDESLIKLAKDTRTEMRKSRGVEDIACDT
ncbi:hypothetical protein DDE82_008550 [Stemphylium lycopersici]|uniref:Uncharacterized protein n=1 Tax=Stemphylium lycopersici TaxID=183478 RepID=A0A364MRS3_STELY|nr:hypothetical protein DDE82_008550 [Stemphylium lycopersici]RAR01249.1 hypothetical protein DDE83_008951 [Stemphylium lycopersici]